MKELTDKVNMDNLSLIIKTLRSKATSSTFFNKSNTKLLLKIKNGNNQYVKNFLERIDAKKTDLNETYLKEADDKDNNKKLNIDSSYNLTLNTDALNKLGISIYDSYPYTELKANLCSFINKLNIEHLKDSVQDTPSANGKADSNNALSPAKRNKGTVLDTDTVIFDNFFNAADELFSNTFFHEQRLVKVLCDYLSESCSQDNDKVLFLSNVLPYAEYSLLNDHNCSIDSFVNVDSKMSIDAKVNFEALKRFDENLKKTSSHAQGLKSDSLNLNENTVFLRDYEANLVPDECEKQVDAAGNADIDDTSYLHAPSLELNFVRALLLQINSPLTPYVSRQELIDNPHSAAFVCQSLFKGDIQNLCKYYYSLYNLLKRTVQKRFVLFIPHVITYTNANEGILFRKTLLEDNYLSAVLRLPRFFCADKDLLIDVLVFDKENVSNSVAKGYSEVLNTASSDSKKAYSKITDLKITDKKLLLCNLSTANCLDEKLSSRAHSVLALKTVNEVSHALSCLGADTFQKNSEHCKFVSISSIKSNADKLCKLDPAAYVSPTDVLDSVAYIKKGTVELDKIATIYKALTCKAPADTDFKEKLCELNLNDVPESGIITSVPKEVEVELGLKQAKRNLLIDGDVVISVKGAVGKVGFYKEGQKKVMAGQCFAIIRSKDPDLYSQELIFALLRNDDMQDYIKTKITGDKLKVLQLSELKAIPLPAATESMKAKACRITQELYDSQIKLIEIKESIKALGQVRLD